MVPKKLGCHNKVAATEIPCMVQQEHGCQCNSTGYLTKQQTL